MEPHQQRVVDEKAELDDKRTKLHAFMQGDLFFKFCDGDEQIRMIRQGNAMDEYSVILGERIAAFK